MLNILSGVYDNSALTRVRLHGIHIILPLRKAVPRKFFQNGNYIPGVLKNSRRKVIYSVGAE